MRSNLRIRECLFLASTNLFRRKGFFLLNLVFITLSLVVLIAIPSLVNSLFSFMDTTYYTSVDLRTVSVRSRNNELTEEEALEKVSALPYVLSIFSQPDRAGGYLEHPILSDHAFDKTIVLYRGDENTIPPLVAGAPFSKSSNNVGIIPDKFSPTSIQLSNLETVPYLDGISLLGQELTVKYYSLDYSKDWFEPTIAEWHEYTFTVVGVYNSDLSWQFRNVVIVPPAEAKMICKARLGNYDDIEPPEGYIVARFTWQLDVIIDKYENLEKAIVDISNMGLNASQKVYLDFSSYDTVKTYTYLITVILLGVAFLNSILSSWTSFKSRVGEIGMLKAMGFNNSAVRTMMVCELLTIGILSFCISLFITSILMTYIKHHVLYPYGFLLKVPMKIDPQSFILGLVLSLAMPVLGGLATIKKAVNLPPAAAMRTIK